MTTRLRLGVNVDHVATIRNARGGDHPDPLIAAKVAAAVGADGITAHLREDRRHIRDADMFRLKDEVGLPLNFEMAATDEMALIAADVLPESCCLVPERREELTTEGGLTVHGNHNRLRPFIAGLQVLGIRVSLFIDPEPQEIEAAKVVGADIIELHTGPYVEAKGAARQKELERLRRAAVLAERLGLECHAGHGLNYETIEGVAAIPQVVMVNIGHFLIGESVTVGLPEAIRRMRQLMETGRRQRACT